MIKLFNVTTGEPLDITAHTGNYKRSDNIDSLGMEFTFDLLDNPVDKYASGYALEIGSKILVSHNGTNIFEGVIVSYSRNKLHTYQYKAFDYAFYLNKSQARIQFNNITVKQAIEKLCGQEGVTVTIGCDLPTTVTKIYNGEVISDIIDDLLKQVTDETGDKFRREYKDGSLYIDKYTNLIINAYYKPSKNDHGFNPTELVGSFNSSYSLENMKNRIVIVSSNEKQENVLAEQVDDESISTFGKLTHYEKIDDKTHAQANTIASTKLKELNKITRSFSVTLFGDDSVRSGRSMVFNQPDINLVGTFNIKNCTHVYNGRVHTMDLELDMGGV